jgi:serine protease Do
MSSNQNLVRSAATTCAAIRSSFGRGAATLALGGCLATLAGGTLLAQPRQALETLGEDHHKSGAVTLRAFQSVAEITRDSVVQLRQDGGRVALGTVVSATGLVLTKASEVQGDDLTCRLPDGTEVAARVIRVADDNDLALVQVESDALRPVAWAVDLPSIGQWAVTPGLGGVPESVGIISAPPRGVQPRRALIGVELDLNRSEPSVAKLIPGLGAEQAGVAAGDQVLAVNDSPVETREALVRMLREFRAGQTVRLRIRRAEETLELEVAMSVQNPEATARPLDRGERMNRMGSTLSARADGFEEVLTHDTVLQAWQCGGPLVNLEGRAIGLNIARAGRTASYALPAGRVSEIVAELMEQVETAPPSIPGK